MAYLRSCTLSTETKRHHPIKLPAKYSRRVFKYSVVAPNKTIQLCKKAFMAILNISEGRLRHKVTSKEGRKKSLIDARGHHDNRKRTPEEQLNGVRDFFKKYPHRQSHYSRNENKI